MIAAQRESVMHIPTVPWKRAEGGAVGQADAARRMRLELRDLQRRATDADLRMLAYLIDCAIIEAERAARAADAA